MPSRLRPSFQRRVTEDVQTTLVELTSKDVENASTTNVTPATDTYEDGPPVAIDNEQQRGVQNVELVTQTWTKGSLSAVFVKCLLSYSIIFTGKH